MNKPAFFFDTANLEYIEQAWEKLSEVFEPEDLVGITTNPNAMAKEGANVSVEAHLEQTRKLAKLLSTIREDGVLYVQIPNSTMTLESALKWAKLHRDAVGDLCKLGLKISPNAEYLNNISEFNKLGVLPNVTGLADAGTALLCLSYDVRYISIIPGRMEEKGVDATNHLLFLKSRNENLSVTGNMNYKREVITGSMRTLDGLERAIQCGTVPTIGTRVFDKILATPAAIADFRHMWDKPNMASANLLNHLTPEQNDVTRKLSLDFFEQMDKLGEPLASDFES